MAVERAERNSDGSYDAFDSGGFGKDYHGQDVFGGRIGRTGIGGIHFGGKAAGDFSGADELGEGHFTERYTNYGQVTQTEAPDTSAFEGEANEVADSMRESIQGVNEETAENSNTGSTMDTSFQIGGIEEDKEKLKQELESSGLDFNDPTWGEAYQRELERAEERLNKTNEWADKMMSENEKKHSSVNNSIDYLDNLSDKTSNIAYNAAYSIMDNLESLAASYGVDDFDRNKIEEAYKERGTEVLRNANDEIFERKNAEIDKVVKGAQGKRDKFKNIVDSYKSSTTDKTKTSFTDKMKPSTEAKPDIVKQVDKEKLKQELERLERAEEELGETNEWADKMKSALNKSKNAFNTSIDSLDNKSISVRLANKLYNTADTVLDGFETLAKDYGIDDFDRNKIKEAYKEKGTDALRDGLDKICEEIEAYIDKEVKGAQGKRDNFKSIVDSYKSSTTDKTKTSFTDKMKPSTEAKAGTNMSSAKTSPSDYLTKANKDSTKELTPSRNDFGNHAADTLKGVVDRIADNTTADALGLQSIEDFAKENGYDPNKLSTMKAYRSYQNKQIMKAIPGIVKQIGSYITERVKDAVDPSQLPERIRNTLARYNLATLIGAAILSIKSGAGLQASIDQALTVVDPEDQAAVSDYLEDVLNDEGTVNDLGNAFDDALAPEQNSDSNELDESIVNVGRKDNTDYSGFNAGLGTTSDADVKVFIARNVKSDPILRKMISKITGK